MRPSNSVPGGCVIGLFGFGCCLYASFCGYALYRIWQSGKIESRQDSFNQLMWHAVLALLLGGFCLVSGWRLAIRTGAYDHWDQNEPRAKF